MTPPDLDALEKLAARIKSAGNDRRYPRFSDMEAAGIGLEALIAELKEARECLQRFEWSCEQLARTRSQASYDQMVSDGQAQELLELDNARRAARAFLARNGKVEG